MRNVSTQKRLIQTLLLLAIVALIVYLAVKILQHSNSSVVASQPERKKLPDDVEQLIERYTYQENDHGLDINISGNRIVFRGRKMLGLRSNVVKATYFETIRGTLRSENGLVEFSASDAEWELNPTSPLVLSKNVSIAFNNKTIPDVKKARIYFRQGVLEVTNNRKEIFHFR